MNQVKSRLIRLILIHPDSSLFQSCSNAIRRYRHAIEIVTFARPHCRFDADFAVAFAEPSVCFEFFADVVRVARQFP